MTGQCRRAACSNHMMHPGGGPTTETGQHHHHPLQMEPIPPLFFSWHEAAQSFSHSTFNYHVDFFPRRNRRDSSSTVCGARQSRQRQPAYGPPQSFFNVSFNKRGPVEGRTCFAQSQHAVHNPLTNLLRSALVHKCGPLTHWPTSRAVQMRREWRDAKKQLGRPVRPSFVFYFAKNEVQDSRLSTKPTISHWITGANILTRGQRITARGPESCVENQVVASPGPGHGPDPTALIAWKLFKDSNVQRNTNGGFEIRVDQDSGQSETGQGFHAHGILLTIRGLWVTSHAGPAADTGAWEPLSLAVDAIMDITRRPHDGGGGATTIYSNFRRAESARQFSSTCTIFGWHPKCLGKKKQARPARMESSAMCPF